MKLKKQISMLLNLMIFVSSVNVFAYTSFPSEVAEKELKTWQYNSDYYASGEPTDEGVWGDSYGNDDVWNVRFGHDYGNGYEIMTATYDSGRDRPHLIEPTGGLSASGYGKNGFIHFIKDNIGYGEFKTDYDFYLVWKSPIDGYVKFDIMGETYWGKTYYTHFSVIHNNAVLDNWSEKGVHTGRHSNRLIEVKKGDEIALKVTSEGEGCNFDFSVSEAGTVIVPRSDANKEWSYLQDYINCGKPQFAYWGDSYGKQNVWNVSFYNIETDEEVEAQYGQANQYAKGWINPDNGGYIAIEGTKSYGELAKLQGYQARVNYHVKEEGTIIASLDGATVWGNPNTDGKFILLKNDVEIDSFITSGNRNNSSTWKNITETIDVQAGDVISFAVAQNNGSDAFDIRASVTSVHGVQVSEDPEMVYKNELGEIVSEPVVGGSVSASLPVFNAGKEPVKATVLIALYDESGALVQVGTECYENITSGMTLDVTATVQIEKEPHSLKVLVWEEISTLKPYYRGYTYNFN